MLDSWGKYKLSKRKELDDLLGPVVELDPVWNGGKRREKIQEPKILNQEKFELRVWERFNSQAKAFNELRRRREEEPPPPKVPVTPGYVDRPYQPPSGPERKIG